MHFVLRGNMISYEARYFKLNRILLLLVGLWPYQQPKYARLQVFILFGIFTYGILYQLRILVTEKLTFNFMVNVFSLTLCHIIGGIQYMSFWINMNTVKWLLDYLMYMCNELKDDNEIAIIESYGRIIQRYTVVLTSLIMFLIFIIITESILGQNVEGSLLVNESQSHRALMWITDFANRKKDICLILLHTNVLICIELIVTVATGSMLIGYLQYSCGMFSIACYRIQQAINIDQENQTNINPKKEIIVSKGIIYAVDIHRKAMEYCKFLITKFEGTFFLMIVLGVTSLSLNIYRLLQIISFREDIRELLIHITYVKTSILYMFLSNYIGQQVTDHYNNIFFNAYNVRWYMTPLSIQRLIVLLLQRGNKNFTLNIGRLFSASLECFARLSSASMSYFTVMYSMQQRD
ncbi:uncharacterized protein LOC116842122 [Odontomachus brunneus]|uniref:uncharacterized protein LOC116842122 n=1 Tax=Odontomachus brunneus TaxID=486640 RepID=UPI0013F25959|nr:uncharacterized protein LOC116842122 [Odontomachus brunneus]